MTRSRLAYPALLCCLVAGVASTAQAQSRVFASARTGSDANSCSNIATPCQTLQGAVNQVAAGGAVLVLDTGGYGPLSINKAVSIEAPPGIEAFIHPASGSAITILAGGADVVVLRGLTLSVGTLYGIDFISGGALHVEQCVIQGFVHGIISRISGVSQFFIEDTVIRDCAQEGINLFTFGADVVRGTIDGCSLKGNGGFGLLSEDFTRTVVRNTVAVGNGVGIGIIVFNTAGVGNLTIDRCTAANNSTRGIQAGSFNAGPAVVRISNSTITGNGGPASFVWGGVGQFGPAQCFSRLNNTVEGNFVDLIGTIGSFTPR